MTKVMAGEWAPSIPVNAIAPGYVRDRSRRGADRTRRDRPRRCRAAFSYGRLGRPEEVARAVTYLVSDEAEFVNGVTLPADGGWLVFGRNL